MVEHTSILKNLARRHSGPEAIAYRLARSRVFNEFIAHSATIGRETFWHERGVIVNDTHLAIAHLRNRDAESARPVLHDAIDRMEELLKIYPRIVQFRADLFEMLMIAGNIDWNSGKQELAMEHWTDAISEFETSLKINANDNRIRRRFAQVLQMVAARHAQQQSIDDSLECLEKAEIQMHVVIESPIEMERKEADRKVLEMIVAQRNKISAAE